MEKTESPSQIQNHGIPQIKRDSLTQQNVKPTSALYKGHVDKRRAN